MPDPYTALPFPPVSSWHRCLRAVGLVAVLTTLVSTPAVAGLRVIGVEPTGPDPTPFSRIRVSFSEPVREGTFLPEDVALLGPGGTPLLLGSVTAIESTRYEVVVNFAPGQGLGVFALSIGPDVLDGAGRPMDQDGDGTPGEAEGDAFRGRLVAQTTAVGAENRVWDHEHLVVVAPVTLQGAHAFGTVELWRGGTMVIAGPELAVEGLTMREQSGCALAGGTTLSIAGVLEVGEGTILTVQSVGREGQVGGVWAGRGATLHAGNLVVAAGGRISADGWGYLEELGPGSARNASGTHGGRGYGNATAPYGDAERPVELGSGGHNNTRGGGAIHLVVSGTLQVEGDISADALTWSVQGYGSAGGSIWIETATLRGAGSIHANGSTRGTQDGGGGRVAVYAHDISGFADPRRITASAGGAEGQHGTALLFDTSQPGKHVAVYQRHALEAGQTASYASLRLNEDAVLDLGGGGSLSVSGPLVIETNAVVWVRCRDIAEMIAGQWRGRGATLTLGSLRVAEGGHITADGQGYLAQGGPGGSRSQPGVHGGHVEGNPAAPYGSPTQPVDPGSGGSSHTAGGGAIRLVVTNLLQLDGRISADATTWYQFGGHSAGGSVWIDTGQLAGKGTITADGNFKGASGGSGGRVAVYYDDVSQWTGLPGSGARSQVANAEHGTAYFVNRKTDTTTLANGFVLEDDSILTFPNLTLVSNATLRLGGGSLVHVPGTLRILDGATLVLGGKNTLLQVNDEWVGEGCRMTVGDLVIEAGGHLSADGQGYAASDSGQPVRYTGSGPGGGGEDGGGGGYGGRGGFVNRGRTYGSENYPTDLGSGGGGAHSTARGGGAIQIVVGALTLDGLISANGLQNDYGWNRGGGSGGSLFVSAGTLSGGGLFTANGGDSAFWDGVFTDGAGGGGRIAVYASVMAGFAGQDRSTARPGAGLSPQAEPGTVHFFSAPGFSVRLADDHCHGEEWVGFEALAVDFRGLSVALEVTGNGASVALASGLTVLDTVAWDTTRLADGRYELHATFSRAGTVLGEARRSVVVLNDAEWHSGEIASDVTWEADRLHVIEGRLHVPAGVRVTLAPGAIVKLTDGAVVHLADGGAFEAVGVGPEAGALTSIHDDVAGGDQNFDGAATTAQPATWRVRAGALGRVALSRDTRVAGGLFEQTGRTLTASEFWGGGFVYHLAGTTIVPTNTVLTVEAGSIIKLNGAEIQVQAGGKLTAPGTPAKPIVFTSLADDAFGGDSNDDGARTSPTAGDWRGLKCLGGELELTSASLFYAGGGNESMVRVQRGATVRLRDCQLRYTTQEAVSQRDGAGTVSLVNSVIANTTVALHGLSGTNTAVNCTFVDNGTGVMAGGTAGFSLENTLIAYGSQSGIMAFGSVVPTVRYCNLWGFTRGPTSGMADPAGQNGNLALDPFLVRRALGDFRLNPRSPLIDAADSTVAPAADLHGLVRVDDPDKLNVGLPDAQMRFADIGAFEFNASQVEDVDLAVGEVTGPPAALAGESVTVRWQVTNRGTNAVLGPWYDTLWLVNDPTQWPTEILVADRPVLPGVTLAPGESRPVEMTVRVPGCPPREYVWQVKVNSHREVYEAGRHTNNVAVSAARTVLAIPDLDLSGTPLLGEFEATDQPKWFRFVPTLDVDLELTLTLDRAGSRVAMYVGAGYLPGPTRTDFRAGERAAPQSTIRIGNTRNEVYYLVLQPGLLATKPLGFTLVARQLELGVSRISPNLVGNGGRATLTVEGSALPRLAGARLAVSGGGSVAAARLDYLSSAELRATFDLTGQPAGVADLFLTRDGADLLRVAKAVEITEGGGVAYQIEVEGTEILRAGREYPFTVHWANSSSVDAPLLLIEVETPSWVQIAEKAGGRAIAGRLLFFTPQPGSSEPSLAPGVAGARRFFVMPRQVGGFDLTVRAYPLDDPALVEHEVDWPAIEQQVRPPGMDAAFWARYWNVLQGRLGTNSQQMLRTLALRAVEQVQLEEPGLPLPENRGVNMLQAMLPEIAASVRSARAATVRSGIRRHGGGGSSGGQVHALVVASADYSAYNPAGVDLNDGAVDADVWADYYSTVAEATDVHKFVDRATPIPVDAGLGPGDEGGAHEGEANLLSRLKQMADEAQPGDVLVFHYSGHSLQEGLQLPAREGNGTHVVSWTKIYNALADTKASKIVMTLDSCYSGGAVETFGRWEGGYDVVNNPLPAIPVDPNKWIVVSATDPTELAKSGLWGDGGLLTKQFINQLEANDGEISFYDAFAGMGGEIRNWGRVQHPMWYGNDKTFSFKGADQFGEGKDDLPKNPGSFKPAAPKRGPVKTRAHTAVRSMDPNEKATVGLSENGFIRGEPPIAYTIFFENDPNAGATAPVQELLITDALPVQLDWSTFELAAISFGNQAITFPAGQSAFEGSAGIPRDPYPVRVDIALNPTSGLVTWLIRSWDEATQDLPLDPLAGFLPVNDATGRGQGSVSFRVKPVPNLANGTVIYNQATITFDPTYGVNPPIRTATVRNTIDLQAPTSRVAALPATSPGRMTVAWSGSDANGSGVASYDVYAAVDRGPYLPWRQATAESNAVFVGELGRTYSFFSIARDRVGNVEPLKTAAEAQTTVNAAAPGYDTWLVGHFSAAELADPALEAVLWGEEADPDRDGRANLVEYFAGSQPREPDTTPFLTAAIESGRFAVYFRRSKEAVELKPVLEVSGDLRTWQVLVDPPEAVEDLGAAWVLRATVPIEAAAARFVRLGLERQDAP